MQRIGFGYLALLNCLLVGCIILMAPNCVAQPYLAREITVSSGSQRVGDLLDKVSRQQNFYFAYNSNAVDVDQRVNLQSYRGTLLGFLEQLLGSAYVFKESPGYVIIRYAPRLIDLTVSIEQRRGRPLVVEGRVRDASDGTAISQASIYERNVLASTLSGATGDFRLSFRRPNETIWLTVSKENYKDTTIALLLPVEVGSKSVARRYWFFPENESSGLERTALGRFFTNSKQRIQRINLDGFFAYNAYQISLLPQISSQGLFNSQVVNQVSLNIIGGHTAGVNGVEVGGIFNVNQQDVRYFQTAGLFNLVGRKLEGVQIAGISNIVVGNVSGMQVSGVGNRSGNV
ncbi:MAG TPA: carboxypeptidase-like regulatory domain-containing protein, partial [Parapedobacter sp.]|nr:carboxypeptidase-like regulatory domain-containing protein [Parapedobacter sp.]